MTYDSLRWLMEMNFWGVVHGTMAFLHPPRSRVRKSSAIRASRTS